MCRQNTDISVLYGKQGVKNDTNTKVFKVFCIGRISLTSDTRRWRSASWSRRSSRSSRVAWSSPGRRCSTRTRSTRKLFWCLLISWRCSSRLWARTARVRVPGWKQVAICSILADHIGPPTRGSYTDFTEIPQKCSSDSLKPIYRNPIHPKIVNCLAFHGREESFLQRLT